MSLQAYINSTNLSTTNVARADADELSNPEKVLVITADGRTLVGDLLSCDQLTNIVLNNTTERIIRPPEDPEPSSEVPHGLYLVRGDNITICGLVEKELDASIDWTKVVCIPQLYSGLADHSQRGEVIGGTKHV
jgi:U6 snRNA-associated Sm-like protein LSm8